MKIVRYRIAQNANRKVTEPSLVRTRLILSSIIGLIKAFRMFTNAQGAKVFLRKLVDVLIWIVQLVVINGVGFADLTERAISTI